MKKINLKKIYVSYNQNCIDKIIFSQEFQLTISNTLNVTMVAGDRQNQADMSH